MSGKAPEAGQYWLLWDGDCGFCRRAVQWALQRDRAGLIAATPYQQAPAPPMDEALALACSRAVHLRHPGGRLERAGRACLTALELVGYRRTARLLRLWPLVWGVEAGYWLVARNRILFSKLLFRGK
jgi:predicted DCC family thiol-disulfide oxidoreductase YuxK